MPKYIRDRSKLAERLRLLRDRADLTQQEVADKLMKERVILMRNDLIQSEQKNIKMKNSCGDESAKISADMIFTPSRGGQHPLASLQFIFICDFYKIQINFSAKCLVEFFVPEGVPNVGRMRCPCSCNQQRAEMFLILQCTFKILSKK